MSDARPDLVRAPDAQGVADRVAADLVPVLAALQGEGRVPVVVLTGGSVSRLVHAAVAAHPERDSVAWDRVEVWWGDERYVASEDPERNAGQAWEDLLSRVPVDPSRVHAMPAADDGYADVEAAAWDHAEVLRRAVADRPATGPWFDVLMLGIGPDGHCASLFPDRAEVESEAEVLAVRDAPKPPPTRISLGLRTLRRADRVWFVATGREKAPAVARSVADHDVVATPACGPRGLRQTRWYLDEEAAAGLRR